MRTAVLLLALLTACKATSTVGDGGLPDQSLLDQLSPDQGAPDQAAPKPLIFGLSMVRPGDGELAQQLGVSWVRPTLHWRLLQSTLKRTGLRLKDIDADRVTAFSGAATWTGIDARVEELASRGLKLMPIVGHGYASTLPKLDGKTLTPDSLGRAEYLARQYLVTRATVERFDGDGHLDHPKGYRAEAWQLENELNEALFTAVLGWREPSGLAAMGSAWADPAFLTQLLTTLRQAVMDADPTARCVINLHSDIHPAVDRLGKVPTWTEALTAWKGLVEVIGLDIYPNFLDAAPLRTEVIGQRIKQARALAPGKPIYVMETGYPSGPAELGYSEALQKDYAVGMLTAARSAGADALFWFGTRTQDTHDVVITPTDVKNLQTLMEAFYQGKAAELMLFLLSNPTYVEGQFKEVVGSIQNYWGVVRPDDSKKPAWSVLKQAIDLQP